MNTYKLDKFYSEIREKQKKGEDVDWPKVRVKFQNLLAGNLSHSKMYFFLKKIIDYSEDKETLILDYGAGGGRLVSYLYFLGYKNVVGVDISDQKSNIEFAKKMGMGNVFYEIGGASLPFPDNHFDCIMSECVMEHVHDIRGYYREMSRVLKRGGQGFCYFQHRLVPYDTHSRRWIIHYFPRGIRELFYDKFTQRGSDYYNKILNLKTMSYHFSIARRYFREIHDVRKKRFLEKNYPDDLYEGNLVLRNFAISVMNSRCLGPIFSRMLLIFADADIVFIK